MALIWDGEKFSNVSQEMADELVKNDKAQIAEGIQSTQLKFREEFSGYNNKMMVTGKPKSEVPRSNQEPKQAPKVISTSKLTGLKRAVVK
jgi:hypothetical protein